MIIDLAPAVDGITADVGYSCVARAPTGCSPTSTGPCPASAPSCSRACGPASRMLSLYRELDVLLAQRGWRSCYEHYPDRALGHLVFPLERTRTDPSPLPGFGTAAAEGLLAAGVGGPRHGDRLPGVERHLVLRLPGRARAVGGRAAHRPRRGRREIRGAARRDRGRRLLARRPPAPRPALGRGRLQHRGAAGGCDARPAPGPAPPRAAAPRRHRAGDPRRHRGPARAALFPRPHASRR